MNSDRKPGWLQAFRSRNTELIREIQLHMLELEARVLRLEQAVESIQGPNPGSVRWNKVWLDQTLSRLGEQEQRLKALDKEQKILKERVRLENSLLRKELTELREESQYPSKPCSKFSLTRKNAVSPKIRETAEKLESTYGNG